MQRDYKSSSPFPGGMPTNIQHCHPPSPPPPSPTRSLSPASPNRPLSPSLGPSPVGPNPPCSLSPPTSPSSSLFPQSTRPLSPPPLSSVATAVTRTSTSHSRRTSLQSLSRMPPIREDSNSIFSDVCNAEHRRSRSSFYQYGEDYITAYDRVGLKSSPSPRPTSRASTLSARSLRRSASVRSGKSSKSRRSGHSGPSSLRSASAEPSSNRASEYMTGYLDRGRGINRDRARDRDLERGPVSEPESEAEKDAMMDIRAKVPSCWRRWRRFFMIVLVVLGLAGAAVGIIFGTRSS